MEIVWNQAQTIATCSYRSPHAISSINYNNSVVDVVVLQGRGYIKNVTNENLPQHQQEQIWNQQEHVNENDDDNKSNVLIRPLSSSFVEVNGYVLDDTTARRQEANRHFVAATSDRVSNFDSVKEEEHEDTNNYQETIHHINDPSCYYFESLEQGSWITVTMSTNSVIQIYSVTDYQVATASMYRNNNILDSNDDNTSKTTLRSFEIHCTCHDEENNSNTSDEIKLRPTVFPSLWRRCCAEIIEDYYNQHFHYNNKQHENQVQSNKLKKSTRQTNNVLMCTEKTQDDKYYDSDCFSSDDDDENDDVYYYHSNKKSKTTLETATILPNTASSSHSSTDRLLTHGFHVVIAGGKGVGKSTFVRHWIGQFLSYNHVQYNNNYFHRADVDAKDHYAYTETTSVRQQYHQCHHQLQQQQQQQQFPYCRNLHDRTVIVLDADPSLPEFVPVGMVGLTIVSSPVLYPPHRTLLLYSQNTDKQKGKSSSNSVFKSYYYGSVTPATDPNRYIQLIEQLVHDYYCTFVVPTTTVENDDIVTMPPPPPLLINTDSWIHGYGYELLSTMLQTIFVPNHVVQISGTVVSKTLNLESVVASKNNNNKNNSNNAAEERQTGNNDKVIDACVTKLHCCNAFHTNEQFDGNGFTADATANMQLPISETTYTDFPTECRNDYDDSTMNDFVLHPATTTTTSTMQQQPFLPSNEPLNQALQCILLTPAMTTLSTTTLRTLRTMAYFLLIPFQQILQTKQYTVVADHQTTMALANDNNSLNIDTWNPLSIPNCTLANMLCCALPYVITFDSIQICFTCRDFAVTSTTKLFAILNGSIVGLCCDDTFEINKLTRIRQQHQQQQQLQQQSTKKGTTNDDNFFGQTEQLTASQREPVCVGLGIVRSVDPIRRLLYILTPYPLVSSSVNTLMVSTSGDVTLPKELCSLQPTEDALSISFPYQSIPFHKTNHNQRHNDIHHNDDSSTQQQNSILNQDILGVWPMRTNPSSGRRSYTTESKS